MIQVKRKRSVKRFLYGKEQQNIMKIIGNIGTNLWSDLATIFESLNNSYATKVCGKKIENKLVPFWPKTLGPLVCREWLSESNSRINNGNGATHSWVASTTVTYVVGVRNGTRRIFSRSRAPNPLFLPFRTLPQKLYTTALSKTNRQISPSKLTMSTVMSTDPKS